MVVFHGVLYGISLVLISVDRITYITASIKHDAYFGLKNTKIAVVTTWLIIVIVCFTLIECFPSYLPDFLEIMVIIWDIIFILAALVLYCGVAYRRFKRQHVDLNVTSSRTTTTTTTTTTTGTTTREDDEQTEELFSKSVFFVPCLLVGSYLLLVAIPDVITQLLLEVPNAVSTIVFLLVLFCHVVDGVIYMWGRYCYSVIPHR